MKHGIEKDRIELELNLKGLKQDKSPYEEFINQTVPMLDNLGEYYQKSDGKSKKDTELHLFKKNRFRKIKSCNL